MSSRHVPALDGVRGIAIGLVLLVHLWQGPYVPGLTEVSRAGAYGVDVFFVLSGFLITGILLRSIGSEVYYRNFYIRRALRILPLYWAYITLVFGPRIAVGLFAGRDLPDLGPPWAYYLFLSNFWFAQLGHFTDNGLVDITWSLCIEEQFYLAFPFIVAVAPRRWLVAGLVGVIVASPVLRYLLYDPANPVTVYVLTPLRMDGLAMGALAAVALYHRHAGLEWWSRRLVGPLTLALVVTWGVGWVGPFQGPTAIGHSMVSAWTLTVIGLALALPARHPLVRTLSNPMLVYVGQVSYALYLLHPAAHIVFRVAGVSLGLPELEDSYLMAGSHLVGASLLAVGMATLTWRTLEEPMLQLKHKWAPSDVSAVGAPEPKEASPG